MEKCTGTSGLWKEQWKNNFSFAFFNIYELRIHILKLSVPNLSFITPLKSLQGFMTIKARRDHCTLGGKPERERDGFLPWNSHSQPHGGLCKNENISTANKDKQEHTVLYTLKGDKTQNESPWHMKHNTANISPIERSRLCECSETSSTKPWRRLQHVNRLVLILTSVMQVNLLAAEIIYSYVAGICGIPLELLKSVGPAILLWL